MNKADAAYFSNKALSKSAIDLLLECPALYKAWLEGVDDEQESKALSFGSMFHLLCLQPELFANEFAVTDINLSTKAGREWKKGIPDTVTIVKQEDYEKALLMSEAVRDHPQAKCLFRHYTAEQPIYWMRDGIECKAEPDIVSTVFGQRFCADLKTTESANPEAIQRTIAKYGYHRQAAWYLDGMKAIGQPCEAFIFIFVEKTFPHLVTMCQLDEDALQKGLSECLSAVESLKRCLNSGTFPCYTRDILTISLPKWAA